MTPDHPVACLGVASSPEGKARVRLSAFFLFFFSTAVEGTKLKPGLLIRREGKLLTYMHLSFSIKVAKVELGHGQLAAVCELAIVVRPGSLPCIAVAQSLRSEGENCMISESVQGSLEAGSLCVAVAHPLKAHHLLYS